MRTTLRSGSWGIEWKALAFHGTGVGSEGKELLLKEKRQGCFWKLVGEGK